MSLSSCKSWENHLCSYLLCDLNEFSGDFIKYLIPQMWPEGKRMLKKGALVIRLYSVHVVSLVKLTRKLHIFFSFREDNESSNRELPER